MCRDGDTTSTKREWEKTIDDVVGVGVEPFFAPVRRWEGR
jgi:hypothetical protein